jgi:aldehyde dehydrogenase (NAD+)
VFKTVNPATEDVLAEIGIASDADVDKAMAAARKAYTNVWSKLPGAERAKYLFRIARLIQERSRELAVLESIDNGKPIRETRDVDIPLVAASSTTPGGRTNSPTRAMGPTHRRWGWRRR